MHKSKECTSLCKTIKNKGIAIIKEVIPTLDEHYPTFPINIHSSELHIALMANKSFMIDSLLSEAAHHCKSTSQIEGKYLRNLSTKNQRKNNGIKLEICRELLRRELIHTEADLDQESHLFNKLQIWERKWKILYSHPGSEMFRFLIKVATENDPLCFEIEPTHQWAAHLSQELQNSNMFKANKGRQNADPHISRFS